MILLGVFTLGNTDYYKEISLSEEIPEVIVVSDDPPKERPIIVSKDGREVICPHVTLKGKDTDSINFIDIHYCRSFCFGQGCINKIGCPAYRYLKRKRMETKRRLNSAPILKN